MTQIRDPERRSPRMISSISCVAATVVPRG
jgi:hypothetical protein